MLQHSSQMLKILFLLRHCLTIRGRHAIGSRRAVGEGCSLVVDWFVGGSDFMRIVDGWVMVV